MTEIVKELIGQAAPIITAIAACLAASAGVIAAYASLKGKKTIEETKQVAVAARAESATTDDVAKTNKILGQVYKVTNGNLTKAKTELKDAQQRIAELERQLKEPKEQ
jgi:hypothetical protein